MERPYSQAVRFLRPLRGCCQAKLVESDDGAYYAIKGIDNPEGRRVLVNEYVGARVLSHLGIASATVMPVIVTEEFIDANEEMHFQTSCSRRVRQRPGVYLGCRYEVSPEQVAIYDLLPAVLVPKIMNLHDFCGTLVADQWMGNVDARQCVFFRVSAPPPLETSGYRAVMIDCGGYLNGPAWQLRESPLKGLFYEPSVYHDIHSWADFEPYIESLHGIDKPTVEKWISDIPVEWLGDDKPELELVLGLALRKQERVHRLIEQVVDHNRGIFPGWKG